MKLEINEKGCARINLYLNTIKNEDEKLILAVRKEDLGMEHNTRDYVFIF